MRRRKKRASNGRQQTKARTRKQTPKFPIQPEGWSETASK
jgi:hypothetical protein